MTGKKVIEKNSAIPWNHSTLPGKILVIRLQALGDVIITLPSIQTLKTQLSGTEFHFLTREEFADIPVHCSMFQRIFMVGGKRNIAKQFLHGLNLIPRLMREHYDMVIDLQRNSLSRLIRRSLRPAGYSEFDRFSPLPAAVRTAATMDRLGFQPIGDEIEPPQIIDKKSWMNVLESEGYSRTRSLIIINPAGNFTSKNWPLDNYVAFMKEWSTTVDPTVQFAILGTETLREKADYLKRRVGSQLMSLVGSTTQSEALSIVRTADLVLSEDSGLMHMAWTSGIPTIALFGSTRSDWSRPLGKWSVCLNSSDLECGECQSSTCRFGDVHCLTRYSPHLVVERAVALLKEKKKV